MSITHRVIVVAAGCALVPAFLLGQTEAQKAKLTARELFYAAPQLTATSKAKAKETKAKSHRATVPKVAKAKQSKRPTTTVAESESTKEQSSASSAPEMAQSSAPNYVPVSYTTGIPLGLRYTILRKTGDESDEVPVDSVFHSGDHIRVSVEANDNGYLYIVSQGSSGTWRPMFPSPEIDDGNNRIERGRQYVLPPSPYWITFTDQAGIEKLFIVLSREPIPDLENLIYSLKDKPGMEPTGTSKPKTAKPAKQLLVADNFNPIEDSLVGRLRVYSRDLVIEKVDDSTPGPKKETAVYVVNPSGSANSRVVADVSLKHQ